MRNVAPDKLHELQYKMSCTCDTEEVLCDQILQPRNCLGLDNVVSQKHYIINQLLWVLFGTEK